MTTDKQQTTTTPHTPRRINAQKMHNAASLRSLPLTQHNMSILSNYPSQQQTNKQRYTQVDKLNFLTKLHDAGVVNIEMEAGVFSSFTHYLGIRAAICCVTLLDRLAGDQVTRFFVFVFVFVFVCFCLFVFVCLFVCLFPFLSVCRALVCLGICFARLFFFFAHCLRVSASSSPCAHARLQCTRIIFLPTHPPTHLPCPFTTLRSLTRAPTNEFSFSPSQPHRI
jgi:hypothetical protein